MLEHKQTIPMCIYIFSVIIMPGSVGGGGVMTGLCDQCYICFSVFRRRQDGGLFPPSPYVGYPFFMIPDLGNFCSPYLPNGALASNARTVSIFTLAFT